MSTDLLSVFEGTIFHESIESLFNKVKATLLPETLRYLENISGRIGAKFGPCKNLSQCKEAIRGISEAIGKGKQVEIQYKAISTGEETTRKVDPYQILAVNGGFYLIGLCHLRNDVRTFAVDRIKGLKILGESFYIPQDFDLKDYFQTAFNVMRGKPQKIKIRFSPGASHVARERLWHPTQEIRDLVDGGIELSLKVPINYEIVSWILGFGSAAEVIHPNSLRKRIKVELQKAAGKY